MFIKKIVLGTGILILNSMIMSAYADALLTTNATNEDSAVLVTTGHFAGKCTGTLPAPFTSYTPANTADHPTPWTSVRGICLGSPGGICQATIFMSRDCQSRPVATAELNLAGKALQNVKSFEGTAYKVSTAGSAKLVLEYKPK